MIVSRSRISHNILKNIPLTIKDRKRKKTLPKADVFSNLLVGNARSPIFDVIRKIVVCNISNFFLGCHYLLVLGSLGMVHRYVRSVPIRLIIHHSSCGIKFN